MNRCELMRSIQTAGFALVEANLFLDSHPLDRAALKYFEKYKAIHERLVREYVEKYGPLKALDYDGGDRWKWTDDPFPWALEANM